MLLGVVVDLGLEFFKTYVVIGVWTSSHTKIKEGIVVMQKFRNMMSRARDERGFTLVELLMVMVIIGVLAGLGFTGFNALQKRSAVTQADVYWRDLNTAVGMHKVTEGSFTTDVDELSEFLDIGSKPWDGSMTGFKYKLIEADATATPPQVESVCVWVNDYPSNQNTPSDSAETPTFVGCE